MDKFQLSSLEVLANESSRLLVSLLEVPS